MSYKLSNYLYITNETIDNHGKDNKIVYSLISGAILFLDSSLVEDLLESNLVIFQMNIYRFYLKIKLL